MRVALSLAVLAVLVPAMSAPAMADEGMWTFDAFPSAKVKQLYGFGPDQAWLDRVRKASVRLDGGCSGSVVSGDGLVLTNHHCVSDCAQSLSSPQVNIAADGYLAATRRDEKICPGAEASILQSISDVTDRVKKSTANVSAAEASMARAGAIAAIEKEACGDDKRKRCEVVSLYRGGQYKLYTYDRYDDLRLSFAPELQAAFFGGDPDNFNFPRYALDMALLRLYRDGQPVKFADPLRLDPAGPKDGDLVFVSGHPGSTERMLTIAQLEFQRDHFLPWRAEYLSQIRGSLIAEGTKGDEEYRQVNEALLSIENSLKVFRGQRGALVEPSFFQTKVAEEKKLRDALNSTPALRSKYGDPFGDIEKLIAAQKQAWMPYQMLEVRFGGGSVLLNDARTIVRGAAERAKADNQRLPEFSPSRIGSTQAALLAEAPMHPVLEKVEIAFWLDKTREYLGADHPAVKALFGSRTSREIALDLVDNTQVVDASFRKRLWDNPAGVASSNDPAIALIKRIDTLTRAARAKYEQSVTGPASIAAEKLAGLRFDVLGQSIYPDATFTLRLSYGVVKGWNDPQFGEIKPFTYVSGLWERATGAFPFNLGAKWVGAKSKIPGNIQQNFVSTNDIIGGNSGSPVLNKDGRVIGLAFDGNIHSTGGGYGFDASLNRCVSVSSQLIVASLRNIYGAKSLADELERKS
jgi:hypothetical protein